MSLITSMNVPSVQQGPRRLNAKLNLRNTMHPHVQAMLKALAARKKKGK